MSTCSYRAQTPELAEAIPRVRSLAKLFERKEPTPTPTPTHEIRRGDEIAFYGTHRERLWRKALHDLAKGQEEIVVESMRRPGLIVPIKVSDVISVRRIEPNEGTSPWERED